MAVMARGVRHPIFARVYNAWISPGMDKAGGAVYRQRLLAGLTGEVLEVGAGNGRNFVHYPASVTRVVAVEPEPTLRAIARDAARSAAVPVEVVDGVAERLPAADASCDAVVVSLVLCSVTDPAAVLTEVYRIVRPGGQLRFYEHVRADSPGLLRFQKVLDATVRPLLMGGCHAGRDTAAAIADAGFTITELDRFVFPETKLPQATGTHILGAALRP
jgi:ubiquinone/menaquinone biosynthesis C-methylase UbiE